MKIYFLDKNCSFGTVCKRARNGGNGCSGFQATQKPFRSSAGPKFLYYYTTLTNDVYCSPRFDAKSILTNSIYTLRTNSIFRFSKWTKISVRKRHLSYTYHTLIVNSSYTQCTLIVHTLYTHCTLIKHSSYTHCTFIVYSSYNHRILVAHSSYTHHTLSTTSFRIVQLF